MTQLLVTSNVIYYTASERCTETSTREKRMLRRDVYEQHSTQMRDVVAESLQPRRSDIEVIGSIFLMVFARSAGRRRVVCHTAVLRRRRDEQ